MDRRIAPVPNGTSLTSPGSPLSTERQTVLAKMITSVHACALHPIPDPALMPLLVQSWHDALAAIPTDQLPDVYRRAIQAHATSFPLTTGDVIAAWHARPQRPPTRYVTEDVA